MSDKLKIINSSEGLTKGQSQYIGTATDNAIIMEFVGNVINVTDGSPSPNTIVIQKVAPGQTTIGENMQFANFKSLHLPPQIERIETQAFIDCSIAQKVDLEHVKYIGEEAFAGLGVNNENMVKIHLDEVEVVENVAFGDANAEIYLNKDVRQVWEASFANVPILHYSGNLEEAPWGARQWIKD